MKNWKTSVVGLLAAAIATPQILAVFQSQLGAHPVDWQRLGLALCIALIGLLAKDHDSTPSFLAGLETESQKLGKTLLASNIAKFTHGLNLAPLALVPFLLLTGCVTTTNPNGTKSTTLTPQAQTDLQQAGQIAEAALIQGLAGAATGAASNALSQVENTGTVNQKDVASATLYGLTSNMEGYVGTIMPAAIAAASTGVPAVGKVIAPTVSAQLVTQAAIDSINAQAAALASPNP